MSFISNGGYEQTAGLTSLTRMGNVDVVRRTADGLAINYQNFYWTLFITICWTVSNVTVGVTLGMILALAGLLHEVGALAVRVVLLGIGVRHLVAGDEAVLLAVVPLECDLASRLVDLQYRRGDLYGRHHGLALGRRQLGAREQTAEVAVALLVLAQEHEVVVPVGVVLDRASLLRDIDLAADDRVDTVLLGLVGELHRAEQVAVVGHSHRWHLLLGHQLHQLRDFACAVEQRIVGMTSSLTAIRRH